MDIIVTAAFYIPYFVNKIEIRNIVLKVGLVKILNWKNLHLERNQNSA